MGKHCFLRSFNLMDKKISVWRSRSPSIIAISDMIVSGKILSKEISGPVSYLKIHIKRADLQESRQSWEVSDLNITLLKEAVDFRDMSEVTRTSFRNCQLLAINSFSL